LQKINRQYDQVYPENETTTGITLIKEDNKLGEVDAFKT